MQKDEKEKEGSSHYRVDDGKRKAGESAWPGTVSIIRRNRIIVQDDRAGRDGMGRDGEGAGESNRGYSLVLSLACVEHTGVVTQPSNSTPVPTRDSYRNG